MRGMAIGQARCTHMKHRFRGGPCGCWRVRALLYAPLPRDCLNRACFFADAATQAVLLVDRVRRARGYALLRAGCRACAAADAAVCYQEPPPGAFLRIADLEWLAEDRLLPKIEVLALAFCNVEDVAETLARPLSIPSPSPTNMAARLTAMTISRTATTRRIRRSR